MYTVVAQTSRGVGLVLVLILVVAQGTLGQTDEPLSEPLADASASIATSPSSEAQATGTTDSYLWLLQSPFEYTSSVKPLIGDWGVVQVDGESGEVVGRLDVPVADGCPWWGVAGVTDDAVWLVRPVDEVSAWDPESEVRLCFARVPLDGSDPDVFGGPGSSDVMILHGFRQSSGLAGTVAIHDGEPYFIGTRFRYDMPKEKGQTATESGLFRLDASNGDVEFLLPQAPLIASSQGKLFASQIVDNRKCGVRVFDAGSTKSRALSVIKNKDGCSWSLSAGDDLVAVAQAGSNKGALVDPVTEKRIGRLNVDGNAVSGLLVAGGDIWGRQVKKGKYVPAHFVVNGNRTKIKRDKCQACLDPVIAVTPGTVWTFGDGTIRRIDASTRKTTLELDPRELSAVTGTTSE